MAAPDSSVADPAPEPCAEPLSLDDSATDDQLWNPEDQAAWEEFFEDNYEMLIAAGVWWGGSREDSEDAVDYTLVELRVRWSKIRNRAAYARRMVINFVTRAQKGDREKVAKIIAKSTYTLDQCDDHQRAAYEDKQWVLQLLNKLPPTQRAVMACVYDGLPYDEIAQQLGKSEAAIRKNLQLARDRLKQELRREGEQRGGQPLSALSRAATTRKETSR